MTCRKFNFFTLIFVCIGLFVVAIPIVIIDPYFHYHAPLDDFSYKLSNERYQNNGIVRNFDYDAIITGTSMTENFKTSEMNQLYDVQTIKVPYSGGGYKEVSDNIQVALRNNSKIKIIVWGLDAHYLIVDKDAPFRGMAEQGYAYPYYLINENPFDDVAYLWNKDIFFEAIDTVEYTKQGKETTSFDKYGYWYDACIDEFGKEGVLSVYNRKENKTESIGRLPEDKRQIVKENVEQNLGDVVKTHPNVKFIFFIPPYSICWWDARDRDGNITYYIDAMVILAEELLPYSNVELYCFNNNYEMICNLNNYKDEAHYSAEINSKMLNWMRNKEYLLTEQNYQEYFSEIQEFYLNYDYDSIFAE